MDPFAGVSAGMDLMVGYLASLGPGRLIAGLPGQYPSPAARVGARREGSAVHGPQRGARRPEGPEFDD
jgi:hypothetical protein